MSKSKNVAIIIGHLGQDPRVSTIPASGDRVANLSVATSEEWTDSNGARQERTEWHSVVLYRGLAEVADKYLNKGARVYIEGKLRTRKWEDKEGIERFTTEIIGDDLIMLDKAPGAASAPASAPAPAARHR